MSVKVTVSDHQKKEWKNLAKLVRKGGKTGNVIDIGLFGEQGSDLVAYATKNEFGDSSTPARPFLRSTLKVYYKEIINFIKKERFNILFKGNADKSMKRIGLFVESLVKKRITNAKTWARPNSPVTVQRKGSSSPLIDTGRMRASIVSRLRRQIAGQVIRSIGGI